MKHVSISVRRLLVVFMVLFVVSGCSASPHPKNVILIIGDGMGIGAITAARCAGPGADGKLVLDSMPVTGLVKTHSEDSLVTDSAASGTALSTGHKTKNGFVSVDAKGRTLRTILELAGGMGKSTGVVTTDAVTGATPAAFYAHIGSRDEMDSIALQLVNSRITLAMGGGKQFFVPKSAGQDGRSDGRDLTRDARGAGFDVVFDAKGLAASGSRRVLGLFTFDESGPTLEAMLNKSVSMLSANPRGFFLMAESCLPDKGGHGNKIATSLKGVNDLDSALRSAVEYAKKDRRTLVVVTADHETGGLAVQDADGNTVRLKPGWVTTSHTGNMVAVYAFGPGSERFSGTHDNTEFPKIFADLWGRALGD
ncbi:MAG TPA: alkaline phosphatase [Armatimonadota bacterium]|jgi:alkaline phosphatase